MVSGIPTFDNGEFTGKFPGSFIGPDTNVARATAAEFEESALMSTASATP